MPRRKPAKPATPPQPSPSQPSQPEQPEPPQPQHQPSLQHLHAEPLEHVAPGGAGLGGVSEQAGRSEAASAEAQGSGATVRTPGASAATPPPARTCEEEPHPPEETHWIFGYGSIILESSRRSTLAAHSQAEPAPAALVELRDSAGYVREWNFKAPSGFTAVGLRRSDAPLPVCGVLFEAAGALALFDAREAGYDRVALPPEQLEVLAGESAPAAVALRSEPPRDASRHSRSRHRFWTYVPRDTSPASDEHPICQVRVRGRPGLGLGLR